MGATDVAAVVPAAGRAQRFGGGKLLTPIDGTPLIDHTLSSLLGAGVDRIAVVVDATRPLAATAGLGDGRVTLVSNPDPDRGMWSSIQAGLAAVEAAVILVLPADMPFVRASTVAELAAHTAAGGGAVVPVHADRRGHPIVLPGALRDALLAADTASTLSRVLVDLQVDIARLAVDDPGVLRDVDVPADLVTGVPGGLRP